jgi:hypothetical protein
MTWLFGIQSGPGWSANATPDSMSAAAAVAITVLNMADTFFDP